MTQHNDTTGRERSRQHRLDAVLDRRPADDARISPWAGGAPWPGGAAPWAVYPLAGTGARQRARAEAADLDDDLFDNVPI